MVLGFGGEWVLDVLIPFGNKWIGVNFDSAGSTPTFLVYAVTIVGMVLTVFGFWWEVSRYRAEQRRLERKKIFVIEVRGLRDTAGTPLLEAIPARLEGHREQVLIDMRQGVKDGEITVPDAALAKLVSLPIELRRRENGFDRRDITYVYGGLAPVPLTFLTGVLIDDECEVLCFDWDRHAETWRELDGTDDGERFRCLGINDVPDDTCEVALAVSVSYSVLEKDVRAKVGEMPLVSLDLEAGSPDCHWSAEKQRALGSQFLDTVIRLSNRGVVRIHLFLAAQNSVVFRFGKLYDKRNLPEIIVYQYQRATNPPYPWGILMPVCGINQPDVITAAVS